MNRLSTLHYFILTIVMAILLSFIVDAFAEEQNLLSVKSSHLFKLFNYHREKISYPEINNETESSSDEDIIFSNEIQKIKDRPYDDETYNLTFQTLLYNSNINAAYQLALIAVQKRPNDFSWHERLAQTASWSGNYNKGLKEWLYVVKHTDNVEIIKKAISFVKLLGYDQTLAEMLAIYIAQHPNDTQAFIELAAAQNRLDQPFEGLSTLQKINAKNPTREAYELTAAIYHDINQWTNAFRTWHKIDDEFGIDVKSAMAQATMYYMQGQLKPAINILKKAIPKAKLSDKEYWQTLGALAWITNDRSLAILAYNHNINDESNLVSLIQMEFLTHPKQAFYYSLKGWNQFHHPIFFTSSLQLAQQLQKWQTINKILMHLSDKQLVMAEKLPIFWQAQAAVYASYGDEASQKKVLSQGIALHPNMNELKIDLLLLVISNGEYKWVRKIMQMYYEEGLSNIQSGWGTYTNGFDVLNKFYAALTFNQIDLLENLSLNQVVIDYTNILEKAQLSQQAADVRGYLWHRMLTQVNSRSIKLKTIRRSLAQVAPYFVSGTDQIIFLNMVFSDDMEAEDLNILLNWMVPRHYFDLVSFFRTYYMSKDLPDWAAINLALNNNDRPALQKVMKNKDREWPRSDRINAEVALENIPRALEYAYDELTDRPYASDIYTELQIYGLADAERFSIAEENEQFINVIGPRTKMEGKIRLTNTWRALPYAQVWNMRSNQPEFITHVPSYAVNTGVKLEQKIHRGKVTYDLGYRKSLNGFTPLSIDIDYQLDARWMALIKLGFDQENYVDSYMRVGGVQDEAGLSFIYYHTRYDTFFAGGRGLNYYSQDRHYLGNGFDLQGSYEHKFWLSYPDFTLGAFTNFYHFNRNGSYGGNVTNLFPSLTPEELLNPVLVRDTQQANYQQLLPNSYHEYGIMFKFGDQIVDYSHDWRPYFYWAYFYNTITHLSNEMRGGMNRSILGRDSLLIYGDRGTAPATANSTNYTFGMRYMIYF